MADFSQYGGVNPEWEALEKTTTIPAAGPATGQSIEEYQLATNTAREDAANNILATSGLLDKILYNDFAIPTRDSSSIPARLYRSKTAPTNTPLPLYLYYHGGGFLFGTLTTEDAACARIVSDLSILVLSINYRHTPQHRHPTQMHDAHDAYAWTLSHISDLGGDPSRLIVGGVSAGAALASSVAVHAEQKRKIRGLVLAIPWLYHIAAFPFESLASKDVAAYAENRFAPVLPMTMLEEYADLLEASDPEETDLFVGATGAEELKGLPRTAFLVAGRDVLRDDALLFNAKLNEVGTVTRVHVFPGLPHAFFRYDGLESSKEWYSETVESIKWALNE